MQKYFYNAKLINVLNIICVVSLFLYMMHLYKYAIIANDDMLDYFVNTFKNYHGRYLESFIESILIGVIPLKLNLNIQNSTVIMQSVIKSLMFILSAYSLTLPFYKFQKKNIFQPFLILIIFFTSMTFISLLAFEFGLSISAFCFPYILSVPIFSFLILLLFDFYTKPQEISKKQIFLLYFLVIILSTTNELYIYSMLFSLFLLSLISFIQGNKRCTKHTVISFILVFLISLSVFFNKGFSDVVDEYHLSVVFNFSWNEIFVFIYTCIFKLFIKCIVIWIPIIIYFFNFIFSKEKDKKFITFIAVFLFSLLFFFMGLYFLGETFTYENYFEYYNFPRFWVLHPGVLYAFYMQIICISMFCIGRLIKSDKVLDNVIVLTLVIILLISFIFIINNKGSIAPKEIRKTLYILDKLSVFYFKHGKTAILPKKNAEFILPVYDNKMPKDLDDATGKAYKNKVYKDYPYLQYIAKQYKVDVSSGMTFTTKKKAIKIYKKNGGTLTKEELEKLDFNKINEKEE